MRLLLCDVSCRMLSCKLHLTATLLSFVITNNSRALIYCDFNELSSGKFRPKYVIKNYLSFHIFEIINTCQSHFYKYMQQISILKKKFLSTSKIEQEKLRCDFIHS